MNQFKYETSNLKMDIAMEDSQAVITLVAMVLDKETKTVGPTVLESKEVTKVTNDKLVKPNINEQDKPKLNQPPIWIVECEECNDFFTMNKAKHPYDTFECKKCRTVSEFDYSIPVKADYTCECGTKHSVMVHSMSEIVSTKCRSCEMPIDLLWNDKKKQYTKIV